MDTTLILQDFRTRCMGFFFFPVLFFQLDLVNAVVSF
jgi:hypothetical protein